MAKAGLTETALAAQVEVDAKTVDRWRNEGAIPRRPEVKAKVADILGLDQDELWPPPPPEPPSEDRQVTDEVITVWAHRADAPKAQWWKLLSAAQHNIDLLGYAMQFLPEDHSRLDELLIDKAGSGCQIRIALANPDSQVVAERDEEEGLGGTMPERIRTTLDHFEALFGVEGIDLKFHETRMYNSLVRGDNQMLMTPHQYGVKGYRAPLLHLRRASDDGIFDSFVAHFEKVWADSTPIPKP